jgi:hypothetical protein
VRADLLSRAARVWDGPHMNFTSVGSVPGHVSQQESGEMNATYPFSGRALPGQDTVVFELRPAAPGDSVSISLEISDPASNFSPEGTSGSFDPVGTDPWVVQVTDLPPRADGAPCDQVDYALTLGPLYEGASQPSPWYVAVYI